MGASPDSAFMIDPDGVQPFRSAAYAVAEHRVRVRIEEGFDVVVLAGEPGVGKTTLLTELAGRACGGDAAVFLRRPPAGIADVLRHCRTGGDDHGTEGRQVVLVDDADWLSGEILGAAPTLRLQFVLACLPVSVGRLGSAAVVSDAALTVCRLDVLAAHEVGPFIAHGLTAIAVDPDIFTREAVARASDYAHGMPRLLNLLCAEARRRAGINGGARITADMLDAAASVLGLRTVPAAEVIDPLWQPTSPPAQQWRLLQSTPGPERQTTAG